MVGTVQQKAWKTPSAAWRDAVVRSPAYRRLISGEDEKFWEQCADVYIRNRMSGTHFRRVIEWLSYRIGQESVIEIGPGPGVFTRFLSGRCAQVTAVEPSPTNATRLERELSGCPGLRVAREKWEDTALPPHDAVFSACTLYAFPDIEAAIAKMLRCARSRVLLVTMNDEQTFEKGVAAALGLPIPARSELSAALLTDILTDMNLTFCCESFSEEPEYRYPSIEVLVDLWQGSLGIREEHLSDLEAFFRKNGLYAGQTAIRVPRRFTTYMLELAAG